MTFHWSLEELNLRDQTVFMRGWLWHQGAVVRELQLLLINPRGRERSRIRLLDSQPRYDVAAHFPSDGDSLNTGFVGLGSWGCRPSRADRVQLLVTLDKGEPLCLDVTKAACLGSGWRSHWQTKLQQWWGLIQRAFSHFQLGDWRGLRHKVKLHVEQTGAEALPKPQAWRRLIGSLPRKRPVHLIVDHQLGGGANAYRNKQVESWISEGAVAITLSFQISRLTYDLRLHWANQSRHYSAISETEILDVLSCTPLTSIVLNNAVSFASPMRIAPMLLLVKQRTRAQLKLLIHDFFLICPTIYLLGSDGKYCGIPSLSHCDKCLPANNHLFASFYRGNISSWRRTWGTLLGKADEIISFSESSALLLRQAYGEWRSWVPIQVKPHQLQDPPGPPIELPNPKELIIGVVGQIGVQKGCDVVRDLASRIREGGGSERIVVIGSLECRADPNIVRQTGRYDKQDLRRLIVESGANIMLMPSIWPETFSYVTEELMHLKMPIACFDLGAPAERIRTYPKGLVLTSRDPAEILNALRGFFNSLDWNPSPTSHDH
jgi:glycosyltransferase involved in cell wall biosynthesis